MSQKLWPKSKPVVVALWELLVIACFAFALGGSYWWNLLFLLLAAWGGYILGSKYGYKGKT